MVNPTVDPVAADNTTLKSPYAHEHIYVVKCQGQHHRILVRNGRVTLFHHHPDNQAVAAALGDPEARCIHIYQALTQKRLGIQQGPWSLPTHAAGIFHELVRENRHKRLWRAKVQKEQEMGRFWNGYPARDQTDRAVTWALKQARLTLNGYDPHRLYVITDLTAEGHPLGSVYIRDAVNRDVDNESIYRNKQYGRKGVRFRSRLRKNSELTLVTVPVRTSWYERVFQRGIAVVDGFFITDAAAHFVGDRLAVTYLKLEIGHSVPSGCHPGFVFLEEGQWHLDLLQRHLSQLRGRL